MLVGDEDGRNVAPGQARLVQPGCELPHAQAAIHQQAACAQPVAAFNQGRVTGAAAAQVFESTWRGEVLVWHAKKEPPSTRRWRLADFMGGGLSASAAYFRSSAITRTMRSALAEDSGRQLVERADTVEHCPVHGNTVPRRWGADDPN